MSLSLRAANSDNYYQPSDYDARRHGTLNRVNKTHRLGKRKKAHGVIVARFEMPFKVWCLGCDLLIDKGVRFNAQKVPIDAFGEYRRFEFRMRCTGCKTQFVIQTGGVGEGDVAGGGNDSGDGAGGSGDQLSSAESASPSPAPSSVDWPPPPPPAFEGEYICVAGCRRRVESYRDDDATGEERARFGAELRAGEQEKELDDNPLLRHEIQVLSERKAVRAIPTLEQTKALADADNAEDAAQNAQLRHIYRQGGRGRLVGQGREHFVLPLLPLPLDTEIPAEVSQRQRAHPGRREQLARLRARAADH